MSRYDFRTPRLYLDLALAPGLRVALPAPQLHYLKDVLRLKPGAGVLVFNGRDGEWRAVLEPIDRRSLALRLDTQTRAQMAPCNLRYMFAPLKRTRLDYMVQKAVEMGAARLQPVVTRHTQSERVNTARMQANAIEAAEQCGILNIPAVDEPQPLAYVLDALEPERVLIFCDEDAPVADPLAALAAARRERGMPEDGREAGVGQAQGPDAQPNGPDGGFAGLSVEPQAGAWCGLPLAVLIGPEGGFHPDERALLLKRSSVVRLALGPRILRADTAAVAALALVQAVLGDWR